ncbi:hypothetical protein ES708_29629 [subsurface metagenome]
MENKNPLNLPPGSIRAIIALMLTAAIIVAMFVNVVVPDVVFGFLGAVIGFYFAHRANNTEKH